MWKIQGKFSEQIFFTENRDNPWTKVLKSHKIKIKEIFREEDQEDNRYAKKNRH